MNVSKMLNYGVAFIHREIGNGYYFKREYDKAIVEYGKAVAINNKYFEAYYDIGVVYGEKKEYEKAIRQYEKALDINPKFSLAYYNMGYIYNEVGNITESVNCLRLAAKLGNEAARKYLTENEVDWKK